MSSQEVRLRFRQGAPTVLVRDLTGHDERRVRDASTRSAVEFLARLVQWPAGMPGQADELAAPDRDRLLAAIYQRTYGDKVESTTACTVCASPFDLSFSLEGLTAVLDRSAGSSATEVLPDGTLRAPSGLRFRLPTARDELEVSVLPPEQAAQALAARCAVESLGGDPLATVEEAIEEVAPVLDLDIGTVCPECGARQVVRFDVQFYLLRAIEQERMQMAREVHRLAAAYGWRLEEILGLERTERRALVQLIEGEISPRRRGQ